MELTQLLSRTNLKITFNELVIRVQDACLSLIEIIKSSKGKFVLKIFYSDRSINNIQDYVKVIQVGSRALVSTLEIDLNSTTRPERCTIDLLIGLIFNYD